MFTSICLLKLSCRLLLNHNVSCTSNYYIINENKIKYSATTDSLAYLAFHYTSICKAVITGIQIKKSGYIWSILFDDICYGRVVTRATSTYSQLLIF